MLDICERYSLHHTVSCIPYSQASSCLGDCFSLFWRH